MTPRRPSLHDVAHRLRIAFMPQLGGEGRPAAGPQWSEWPDESWPALAAGALYFAIAAFDDWRVRGRRFAEHPRVLFGYELLRIRELDPV